MKTALKPIGTLTEIARSEDFRRALCLAACLFGAALIWLGPRLSGLGELHGSWCVSGDINFADRLGGLAWRATQHCPYCFLGIAFIFSGFAGLAMNPERDNR